jgi:hypothetical protein
MDVPNEAGTNSVKFGGEFDDTAAHDTHVVSSIERKLGSTVCRDVI